MTREPFCGIHTRDGDFASEADERLTQLSGELTSRGNSSHTPVLRQLDTDLWPLADINIIVPHR